MCLTLGRVAWRGRTLYHAMRKYCYFTTSSSYHPVAVPLPVPVLVPVPVLLYRLNLQNAALSLTGAPGRTR